MATSLRAGRTRRPPTPSVAPRHADAVIPMTQEQRHIWMHAARNPSVSLYNEPFTIIRRGPFDLAAFRAAFDTVVERHEAWRTTFGDVGGDPVQIIHPAMRTDLTYVDLSDIPAEQRQSQALALAEADAWAPFDLEKGPAFRGRVVKIAEDDHRLYLVIHHLIFDGVSINRVMMPELAAIYAANAGGEPHGLSGPAAQYGDYAVWQRDIERGRTDEVQLEYWRRALGGNLPIIQLPADRPRPADPQPDGAMETFMIGADLMAGLKETSRAGGVTLYMTMLATFGTLLHRYSGQEDIVVGGVADTRRRPETQKMMGYCINSMALRTRPTPDMPFREYLHQVRDVVIGGIENCDVPFGQVVRSLEIRSETAVTPVFQVMFTLDPPRARNVDGWSLEALQVAPRTAKYDFYVEITDLGETMLVRVMYATELFDRQTIVDLNRHWERLLRGVVAAPASRLIDLPMMDESQTATMLSIATGTIDDAPERTLHAALRQRADMRAAHPAVISGDVTVSYGAFWTGVDELGLHLRLAGVGRGDLVAVCMGRSTHSVAAPLAIMQAGAAYLPLDPSFPASRLDAIVSDASPVLVLTDRNSVGRLPGWGIPVLVCDDLPTSRPAARTLPIIAGPRPDDLAYVIYTSGSTGTPKGVEIEHRSAVNLLGSMRRVPGFGQDDVLLAITTPTFDISILELFLPLLAGGTVVVATGREATEPLAQADAILRRGATVMQGTPATWRALFASGWRGHPGLKVLCGGEALPRDLADQIIDAGMTLWNMYGPTETTVWSSIEEVKRERITIGRPIANTRMIVLDDAGRPQPPNVAGHLLIGGAGVARGYRDETLTRNGFVRLDVAGGERFYRTGDMALLRRDGRCEWLGRRDGQVKVRGYRIDLGDVESAIASHPEVAMAAVRMFDDEGEGGLAAYYVPRRDQGPDAGAIRDHLRRILPSYMIPSRFATIAAMPLSTSGKVDRKALPAIEPEPVGRLDHQSPQGDVETRLAAIWSDALGVAEVSVTTDFQDLGGHSLMAARMMGRIATEFGTKLPISTLLRAPTVRSMATLIEGGDTPQPAPDTVLIQDGRGTPLFWIDAVPNLRPGYYRAMASAIGDHQAIIGLPIDIDRHHGLSNGTTIAELASDLSDRIQAHASGPPYMLGGWCNGGILAYAVAAELERRAAPVALLVLLDTSNPAMYRTASARMRHQIVQFATLPRGARLPFAVETLGGYASRFRRRHGAPRSETSDLLDLNDRFMRIVKAYEPVPLHATMTLLQPRDGKIDYAPGWRHLVADLHATDVAGGHVSVLDSPHVEQLGRQMATDIGAAARSLPMARPV